MRKILVVTLLLLAAALPLAAQSLSGTVTGIVKDDQGGVLPGVTVTLAGKTGTRTATTDAEGSYRFLAVDPGTYSRHLRAHRLPAEAAGQRGRHDRPHGRHRTWPSASAA